MVVAKIEAIALELPDGSTGTDARDTACFDFNVCNDPAATITESPIYRGSEKETVEGRVGQDLTNVRRQWQIEWDIMTPEQYKKLCEVINLHCNAGHCIKFTISNTCDCGGCGVGHIEPVSGIIKFTGSFEYGKWFGGREDVAITIKESAGGCGDCS